MQKLWDRDRLKDETWLVVPDHPDELPVVWIVYGHPHAPVGTIAIPIPREKIAVLAEALVTEAQRDVHALAQAGSVAAE